MKRCCARRPGRDAGLERDRPRAHAPLRPRREERSSRKSSSRGSRGRRTRRSRTVASRRTSVSPPRRDRALRTLPQGHAAAKRVGSTSLDDGVTVERWRRSRQQTQMRHADRARGRQGARPDGAGAGRRGRGAPRRDSGRRLRRLRVRARLRPRRDRGRRRVRVLRRHGRRRSGERAVPQGRDGRLRRVAPGVGVQGRQPERLRLVRLRPQLPRRPTKSRRREH